MVQENLKFINKKIIKKILKKHFFFIYNNVLQFYFNFFLKKFTNLLMLKGKKKLIEKKIYKFFEILKYKYKIKNPYNEFQILIFNNLVPNIKIIKIGKKKIFFKGLFIDSFSRISITLRIIVKSIKKHKRHLIKNIIKEYFNLKEMNNCDLILYNKNIYKQIEDYEILNDMDFNNKNNYYTDINDF